MALASIVLPVYNGAKHIKEAVESVLAQTFDNFTLFVIDDGSTDNTVTILEEFTDNRLKIIRNEENKKLIYTLNKGLQLSFEGGFTYIIRMDADDICLPHRFEKQIAFMEANPAVGLCGSWVEEFNERGTIKISQRSADDDKIRSELFFQNTIWHPSVIMRINVVRKYNIRYESQFLHAEDYAFWCRMAQVTQLANLQEVLLRYRVHTSNVSVRYASLQRDTAIGINAMNLDYYLLKSNRFPVEQKERIKQMFISLLKKTPVDANAVTKSEITVLKKLILLNKEEKAFNATFFQQDMSDFVLHYWSLWCRQYSFKTFTLLFLYGRFFSRLWPAKQQIVVAGKCFAGWKARTC